jgi:NAD(P)-dependent dehydrogenase (short-subunit alcohol dehydrogenase family)
MASLMTEALDGRVVVITGGTRGLGKELATVCSEHGASVGVISRNGTPAVTRVGVRHVACDVTDKNAMTAALDEISGALGGIDAVVANAGITLDTSHAQDVSLANWRATIDLNLTGTFVTAQAAYPHLAKSGSGRFVVVSSIMARNPRRGVSAYAASKAGAEGLTRSLAVDWARDAICVNAIAPGFIAAGMGELLGKDSLTGPAEKLRSTLLAHIPMRRFGDAADVAALGAYLVSTECAYVTGQVFTIDGGYGLD